jgi:hypothetical protein
MSLCRFRIQRFALSIDGAAKLRSGTADNTTAHSAFANNRGIQVQKLIINGLAGDGSNLVRRRRVSMPTLHAVCAAASAFSC